MRRQRLLLVLSLGVLLFGGCAVPLARGEEMKEAAEETLPDGDFDNVPVNATSAGYDKDIPDGDDGDVLALTDEMFPQLVEAGKGFLAEFYAPWCGHCKALAPAYREAAAALKEFDVTLGKVDATKFDKLALDYGVEGYPTILWVAKNRIKMYNGGRASEEIVTWVKKRIGLGIANLASKEDAEKFLKEHEAVLAGYFKDLKGPEAQAFVESAKDADDVEFAHTDKPAVAKALGLSSSKAASVAVIRKADEKLVEFEGKYTPDAITQFSFANKLPLFVPFSDEAASFIFGGSIKKVIFLFSPDSEYATLTSAFTPVALEYSGKIIFSYVNGSEDEMDNVREFFNVKPDDKKVTAFTTELKADGQKFVMDGELTATNLKAFAADFISGSAKAFFKSQPIPEQNDEAVKVVVGDSFNSVVGDSTKDVLLEVYAPWCGHCKALEPIYNKLAQRLQGAGSIVVAKMDGTANEHPDLQVDSFPTIFFYPANNKSAPIKADVDHKLGALLSFVKEHASEPLSLPDVPEDSDDEEETAEDGELAKDEAETEEGEASPKDEL